MTDQTARDARLFTALGFHWDRTRVPGAVPGSPSDATARYEADLPNHVSAAMALAWSHVTPDQVRTLMSGQTVEAVSGVTRGRVLNYIDAAQRMTEAVRSGLARPTESLILGLHYSVARNDAANWGQFAQDAASSLPTATSRTPTLRSSLECPEQTYANGVWMIQSEIVQQRGRELERGLAFFLFGVAHRFFACANARTFFLLMNGLLISEGLDAIAVRKQMVAEAREKIDRFRVSRDATEMMAFLADCHPAAAAAKAADQACRSLLANWRPACFADLPAPEKARRILMISHSDKLTILAGLLLTDLIKFDRSMPGGAARRAEEMRFDLDGSEPSKEQVLEIKALLEAQPASGPDLFWRLNVARHAGEDWREFDMTRANGWSERDVQTFYRLFDILDILAGAAPVSYQPMPSPNVAIALTSDARAVLVNQGASVLAER